MVNLFIDNSLVKVRFGLTILQACESENIIIPRFCYHSRLPVAGNCRMCLVEVDKMPKLQVACALTVYDNMSIKTNSLAVKKAREGVLEFLLSNHPLDCPICDQGGECDLQELTLTYGSDRSRFKEFKRAVEDKYCGPLIKTVMSRCIHCTRCLRFANDILGDTHFGSSGRGNSMEISTYINKLFSSELSGNLIDLCPVGALTSKPYSFISRAWELKSMSSVDIFDSIHSNIIIDIRGYEVIRVLPRLNSGISEDWISDKVRFCLDGLTLQRLTVPLIKNKNNLFSYISWVSALKIVAEKLKISNRIAFSYGPAADLESLSFLKSLSSFLNGFNINNTSENYFDIDFQNSFKFNTLLKNISKSDACLLVGVNPKVEGALLNYYLRKRYIAGNFLVGVVGSSFQMNINFPFVHLGISFEKFISFVKGKNFFCKCFRKSKKPLIIIGKSFLANLKEFNFNILYNLLQYNLKINNFSWYGLSFFNANSNSYSVYNLGLNLSFGVVSQSFNLLYFLENYKNDLRNISKSAFVIFQGHHGCLNAQKADIILPCTSFLEKASIFVNCEGVSQTSSCVTPPLKYSKNSSLILYSLFYSVTNQVIFDFDLALHKIFFLFLPSINSAIYKNNKYYFEINYFSFEIIYVDNNYIYNSVFNNFYHTDIISISSELMSQCTKQMLNKTSFTFN